MARAKKSGKKVSKVLVKGKKKPAGKKLGKKERILAKAKLREAPEQMKKGKRLSRAKIEELAKREAYDQLEMAKDTELLSMRYKLPAGLDSELDRMPWETVANLASSFKLKIDGENAELRKLQKEIELTRLLILDRISDSKKRGSFDYKFFVDLVKLLERCEKLAVKHEVDLDEFKIFVYVLIEKIKKEKLVVYSPAEGKYKKYEKDKGAFCLIKDDEFGSGLP